VTHPGLSLYLEPPGSSHLLFPGLTGQPSCNHPSAHSLKALTLPFSTAPWGSSPGCSNSPPSPGAHYPAPTGWDGSALLRVLTSEGGSAGSSLPSSTQCPTKTVLPSPRGNVEPQAINLHFYTFFFFFACSTGD
jgi:hypothetical protein